MVMTVAMAAVVVAAVVVAGAAVAAVVLAGVAVATMRSAGTSAVCGVVVASGEPVGVASDTAVWVTPGSVRHQTPTPGVRALPVLLSYPTAPTLHQARATHSPCEGEAGGGGGDAGEGFSPGAVTGSSTVRTSAMGRPNESGAVRHHTPKGVQPCQSDYTSSVACLPRLHLPLGTPLGTAVLIRWARSARTDALRGGARARRCSVAQNMSASRWALAAMRTGTTQ